MIIKIGFTQSDRSRDYCSFDGYEEGAEQKVVTIELDDYESNANIEFIAEAVYEATNNPFPEGLTGVSGQIFHAIYDPRPYYVRSLSVGDTVELLERGQRVACDKLGWKQLEVAK
jgi:hypothetical protein